MQNVCLSCCLLSEHLSPLLKILEYLFDLLRLMSTALTESPEASGPPQSFGARFSKVPNSISIHESNRNEAITQGTVLNTFPVGRPSPPLESQDLLHKSQDERFAPSPVKIQHQDLPEWRKLPEPSQMRQALPPAELTRYLPGNMANQMDSQQDSRFLQARYEPARISSGTVEGIANRKPLANIPAKSVHRPHLPRIRNADPGMSGAGDLEIHHDQQNAQNGGNFVLRSNERSGQETMNAYASNAQNSSHHPTMQQIPGNPSGLELSSTEHGRAQIRRLYHQYLREHPEEDIKQRQQPKQDTVSRDEAIQPPILGNVHSYASAVSPMYPAGHPGQAAGTQGSLSTTPTPPTGTFPSQPYLLSPCK